MLGEIHFEQELKCVCFMMAEAFTKQATTQIAPSPSYSMAFPFAIVLRALSSRFPILDQSITICVHHISPITAPICPLKPLFPNLSDIQFKRDILRYRPRVTPPTQPNQQPQVDVEADSNYRQRMIGVACAYVTYLCPNLQPSIAQAMGIHNKDGDVWSWLVRLLNNQEVSGLTADIILHILKIAGFSLIEKYGVQFHKIVQIIEEHYMPNIPADSDSARLRLMSFLAAYRNRGRSIPRPNPDEIQ